MRPLRLRLKGFTAFRDEQAIDFEGLDLFAIAGQTGSGKSSILDAVTYALYGYVERVGKQCGQLVSQGQPRMVVTLEFAVGEERYRVTRSTPAARGQTKILLERWEDGEWRQAGEGADRVREADAMIRDAVGLDYEAFTRSVLLPQGRFAEFLVGDAKDRRSILTELLGLELFERLAKRAGEAKRDAAVEADANQRLLDTEYAGVTEEAVREAEAAATEAATRDEALGKAEARVRQVAERWAKTEGEVRELTSCAHDARRAAGVARQVADAMDELAAQVDDAEAEAKRAAKAAAEAAKVAEKVSVALAKAESAWGRATDLVALRTKADGLAERRAATREAETELRTARAGTPRLEKAAATAKAAAGKAAAARDGAVASLEAARAALDEAVHADLVAAVRAGVQPGEDCPVCGAKVEALPEAAKAPDLEKARAAAAKAERGLGSAEKGLREAERARDAAISTLEGAAREAERLEKEAARRRKDAEALERELARAFAGKLPADPVAVLQERIERLETLQAEEAGAREAAGTAEREAAAAERERYALLAQVAEARARLEGVAIEGLLGRARAAGGTDLQVPELPSLAEVGKDPSEVAAAVGELARGLERLGEDLDGLAEARVAGEGELLAEAHEAVEELVGPAASPAELVESVAGARRASAAERATAEREAVRARERLAKAGELVLQVRALGERAGRFDALTRELRADRVIAFLQVEALQILAAAGSEHLSGLSGGRYRLAFVEDEFLVVDTWNGDEQRSARTLSGGESFLASLALALALSGQVASLSVTEKARLDSLFLDEGFGTLDPETLEVVVEAIEQLGGDGRMVGVITHVQELAVRLPARIDVEKSPRGSRLKVLV